MFTGREYDSESGTYHYRLRTYDQKTGTFISKDPIGFGGGLNLYVYVENDPVNYTDPLGLVPNPAEAACILGPNPVCIGGVGADILTWAIGGAALGVAVSMSGDDANAIQRQKEYEIIKAISDTPPPPGRNRCSSLSRQIDHAERVVKLYEAWDNKWNQGRHAQKISDWKQRIKNLKDEHRRRCVKK